MKKIFWLISLAGLMLTADALANNAQNCVRLDPVWGNSCGKPDSLQVKVTNRCSQTVYVKMCIEKKGGGWSCGSDSILKPGNTNNGFWACQATGNYRWDACTGGYQECGFKNPR